METRIVRLLLSILLLASFAWSQTPTPQPKPPSQNQQQTTTTHKNDPYYTNSRGQRVRRPMKSQTVPAGATAQCRDGSYSFSQSRRGTCSHHGGVATWLVH